MSSGNSNPKIFQETVHITMLTDSAVDLSKEGGVTEFFMRIIFITDSLPQSCPYFRTIYLTYYFSVTLKVRVALLLFVLTVRILFSKYKRKRQLKITAPTSITRATQVKRACKLLCKLIQDGRQSICPVLFYMHGISTIH